jgi:UPF0271 protein
MTSPWRSRVDADITAAPYSDGYRGVVTAAWDLNADLGEGDPGMDAHLLDIVTSANVACGGHAGDAASMARVCEAAAERGVALGAQVSYVDRQGFGRHRLDVPAHVLAEQIAEQVGVLQEHAVVAGSAVTYVKPHGALYHAAVCEAEIAEVVLDAASGLPVLTLPHGALYEGGVGRGVIVHGEAFADRAYLPTGTLVPRGQPGALVATEDAVAARVRKLVDAGVVVAIDGTVVTTSARSVCVHSDTPGADRLARRVRDALTESGARLMPFAPPPQGP